MSDEAADERTPERMSKIEEVARAIHAACGDERGWPHPECTQCMEAARAAIEAMREPTEAMITRVEARLGDLEDADVGSRYMVRELCSAMVDAALAPAPDTPQR